MNSKPHKLWHIATFQNAKSNSLGKSLLAFLICFIAFSASAGTNKAIRFNGTGDKIVISKPGGGTLGINDQVTFSFWAKRNDATNAQGVLHGKNSTNNSKIYLFMPVNGRIELGANGGRTVSTPDSEGSGNHYKQGVWAHYFCVLNQSTNEMSMWIDGRLIPVRRNFPLGSFSDITNFVLGDYKVEFADFRLWNKALTAANGQTVREGKPVETSNLICHLEFNDSTDLGKNSAANSTLTATASGSPAIIKHIPNVYFMRFDGTNDYFQISDTTIANGKQLKDVNNNISVSFWARSYSYKQNFPFYGKNGSANGHEYSNCRAFSGHLPAGNSIYLDSYQERLIFGVGNHLPTNKWIHWTFVRRKASSTAAGELEVYRNGISVGKNGNISKNMVGLSQFLIGAGAADNDGLNPGYYFRGDIDELCVWNKAIDRTLAIKSMNGEEFSEADNESLIAYLTFNDSADLNKNSVINPGVQITNSGNPSFQLYATNTRAENVATPAYGVEVVKEGEELKWSVDFEDAVVSYNVEKHINGVWTKVTTVAAKGEPNSNYSVVVGEGEFRLTAVDGSGFSQSFATASTKAAFINLNKGWNLISVPFEGADLSALEAEGALWSWNGTAYEKTEKANALQGLWVFSPVAKQVTLSGTQVADATVALSTGWNLVGPAQNCTVPAGVQVFSWETTYQQILETSAGLIQGHGYWMFADKESEVLLK